MKTLRGDRNQCQGCKQYFNSTHSFDKHRVGEFGKDRRCRTTDEMLEIGMAMNQKEFWVGEQWLEMPFARPVCASRSDLNSELIPEEGCEQKMPEITKQEG